MAQLVVAIMAEEVDMRSEGEFLVQFDAKVEDYRGEGKVRKINSEGN